MKLYSDEAPGQQIFSVTRLELITLQENWPTENIEEVDQDLWVFADDDRIPVMRVRVERTN